MTRLSSVAAVAAAAALANQVYFASAQDYEYLGCFHDEDGDRVLGDKIWSSDMTTEVCFDHCKELGASYMSTQWGSECWCSSDGGLDYERHSDAADEDTVCNMSCMGDESEPCGGYYSFDLYKIESTSSGSTSSSAAYGSTYSGDGTYYGETFGGNCAYKTNEPAMYEGMTAMALNKPQYEDTQYGDSFMCGACLRGTANGNGGGGNPIPSSFNGFITDKCPECFHGDLDLSVSGDGRWDIEWTFVECPGEKVSFAFEGSNRYYWKIQPRGTKTPVVTLTINGQEAARTQDNHFVLEGGPWDGAQTVVIKTLSGETHTSDVTGIDGDGVVSPE